MTRTAIGLAAVAALLAVPVDAPRAQTQPNDLRLWTQICVPFIAAGATQASWSQQVAKLQGWGLRVSGSRETYDASAEFADGTEVSFRTGLGDGGHCEVEPQQVSPQFRAELTRFLRRHRARQTEPGLWVMRAHGTQLYVTVDDNEVSVQRQ